jgi:hypothetical protein
MKSIVVLAALAASLSAQERIGGIEFFGYKGIDTDAVRKSLPVHVGDAMSDAMKARVSRAVPTTDVANPCCDENGRVSLYIGLTGKSTAPFRYLPKPTGDQRLSRELVDLADRTDDALIAAVQKGGESAQEDDSAGYGIGKDPELRAWQLKLRDYALHHEQELLTVLASAATDEQRAIAAKALG